MKNLSFLLILAFLISGESNAQTLIAVTNETGSGFYASLDSAIVHSVTGYFIYLHWGSFKISKPINYKLQIVRMLHNGNYCIALNISMRQNNNKCKEMKCLIFCI